MSSTTDPTGTTSTDDSNDNNLNNNNDIDIAEIIKKLPRDCIKCDSPDCMIYNPRNRCSRCHCNYYCSVTCQKNDWKNHKPICIILNEKKNKPEKIIVESNADIHHDNNNNTTYQQQDDNECAICLEKPMKNPIYLKECHHGFCSLCIIQWQQSRKLSVDLAANFNEPDNPLNCPCCRTENIDDIEETFMKNATSLATRATCHTIQSNQVLCEELLREALSYLDQVIASNFPVIFAYLDKAEILLKLNEPSNALETIELLLHVSNERKKHPVMLLLEEREDEIQNDDYSARGEQLMRESTIAAKQYGMPHSILRNDGYYRTYNLQIRCYEKLNQWDNALQIYKKVALCIETSNTNKYNEINDLLPEEQEFRLSSGIGKCFYELKQYKICIDMFNTAIKINRQHPQIHIHKALSQQKLKHIDDAINTMTCVIIHEAPWDIINQKENYILYQKLKLQKELQEKNEPKEIESLV